MFFPVSDYIVLILSIFQITVIATDTLDTRDRFQLAHRTPATDATTTTCLEYATVANLSTIGTNSTFRAAFLQAAPFGTDQSAGILNHAEEQEKSLIDDQALNTECGNLTAIAIEEAPKNFTQGIVGSFRLSVSEGTRCGMGMLMLVMVTMVTTGAAVLL